MRISKKVLKNLAPHGGSRPSDGNSKWRRKEIQSTRDSERKVCKKRLNRLLDKWAEYF